MAKEIIEVALARIEALRQAPEAPETVEALRSALKQKSNLVTARAASVIETRQGLQLSTELESAYQRYAVQLQDKGCLAKTALAKALYSLGVSAEEVFLHGVQHVQKEASWGSPVDAAAELRGVSALGLVRMGHRDAIAHSADLLADAEVQARIMAARALAYSEHEHAALPLRVKVMVGDSDPEVMAECFAALLTLSPRLSVPLVVRFLDHSNDDVRQNAALALGTSRRPEAAEVLFARWRSDIRPQSRRLLALPIATLRSPDSLDFLLEGIADEPPPTAAAIIEALAIYAHDPAALSRIEAAVEAKEDRAVKDAFAQKLKR